MRTIEKRIVVILCCILVLIQMNMSFANSDINTTPEPTLNPVRQLDVPSIIGYIYTSTSTISGNYKENGVTIELKSGTIVLKTTTVSNGKFTLSFAKQKPGTKLILIATREGYLDSKTKTYNVKLEYPTYGKVTINSTYVSGRSYKNSRVTIYVNGNNYGSSKATNGSYKINLKNKPMLGKPYTVKAEYGSYSSKVSIFISGGWSMAKDTTGKAHRLTLNYNLSPMAKSVKKLFDFNKKQGIKSLLVMVPPSVLEGKSELPSGVTDYSNQLSDKFLKTIESYGYNTMDLRDSYSKDGFYNNDIYYKYDHHWTIPAGFRATTYVVDKMNDLYNYKLDPKNKYSNYNNYTRYTYKNYYRGSIASNRFPGTGYENFTKMYPKFSTNFTISSYNDSKQLTKRVSGNFKDALINNSMIYKGGPCYSSYLRGFSKQTEVVNNKADNKLTALVITTSIGRPFSAFLSNYFKKVANIDLQGEKFNRSVYTYEKELKPNVCILLYTAHTFGKPGVWEFENNK